MTPGSLPPSDAAPDANQAVEQPPAPMTPTPGREAESPTPEPRVVATIEEREAAFSHEASVPVTATTDEVLIVPESLRDDVPGAHFAAQPQLSTHVAVSDPPAVGDSAEPSGETPASDEAAEPIIYEDDETGGTLLLRTVFTLLAGGFLLWGQWSSGVIAAEQWGIWVKGAVLANLMVPLGVIWLFFGQGLRTADWMREMGRDPRYNAWNYGWKPRPFLRHFGFALVCLVVMLPFLWYFSRDPNTRLSYQQSFLPPTQTPQSLVRVLVGITIYMLCWEWFFRGFLLFGLAQGLGKYGWVAAIVLQAVLFYFAHSGKPLPEMYSSFGGGLLLGAVCWRAKSFFPAFYAHWLIQVAWILLMR